MKSIVANLILSAAGESSLPNHEERRRALRIDLPFPAIARGVDATGERFTESATLDNLSGCGLVLRLRRSVEPGDTVFLVIRLSTAADEQAPAARVAVRGTIVRTEPQIDGRYGIAIAFEQHRFLYAESAYGAGESRSGDDGA